MKEELKNFERCVLPYVKELLKSKKYSADICRDLSNPFSERLNLELVYDLVKNICENQVSSIDIQVYKVVQKKYKKSGE